MASSKVESSWISTLIPFPCSFLEFAEYLTYNIDFFSNQVQGLKAENMKLKGDNEAKDIQLKLSRLVIVQYTCHFLHFSMSPPLSLPLSPHSERVLKIK